jgi:hypothetical protein
LMLTTLPPLLSLLSKNDYHCCGSSFGPSSLPSEPPQFAF